jgi:hypothetical protein
MCIIDTCTGNRMKNAVFAIIYSMFKYVDVLATQGASGGQTLHYPSQQGKAGRGGGGWGRTLGNYRKSIEEASNNDKSLKMSFLVFIFKDSGTPYLKK